MSPASPLVPSDGSPETGSGAPTVSEVVAALAPIVQQQLPSSIAQLSALVKIPSVSWDGFDPAFVQQSAEAVAELARGLDVFDEVRISQAPTPAGPLGQPAVLATRAAKPGYPTVLLYAHHDVQPPGDEALWESPAYEPTVRGERLYGRGTADDKAGVITHIAAIRALKELHGDDFGPGLALFVEGEEEFGSRSFAAFLAQHREQLAADAIIVADSDNWDTETPGLTVSLRGNVTFRLAVRTLDHASHSGMLGGVVPDAMLATIRLLNSFWDEDGAVAVDGLRSHDAATPAYSEAQLREESGLLPGVTPVGRGELLARTWFQPAITVTGIDAPSVQNASNTIQPLITVKVSARIAPGQTAAEAFEALKAHLESHAPFGAELSISDVDLGNPFLVDTRGWAVDAMSEALGAAWGRETVQLGVGGSIPFIADLVRVFPEAQILVTGVEDPDTRAHSPNESLHLGVLHRAILSEATFLAGLGAG